MGRHHDDVKTSILDYPFARILIRLAVVGVVGLGIALAVVFLLPGGDDTENPKDGADTDAGAGGGGGDGDDPGDEDTEGKSIWRWLGPILGILLCGGLVAVWWLWGREKVEESDGEVVSAGAAEPSVEGSEGEGDMGGKERRVLAEMQKAGLTKQEAEAQGRLALFVAADDVIEGKVAELEQQYQGLDPDDPTLQGVPRKDIDAKNREIFLGLARAILVAESKNGGETAKKFIEAVDFLVVGKQTLEREKASKQGGDHEAKFRSAVQKIVTNGGFVERAPKPDPDLERAPKHDPDSKFIIRKGPRRRYKKKGSGKPKEKKSGVVSDRTRKVKQLMADFDRMYEEEMDHLRGAEDPHEP